MIRTTMIHKKTAVSGRILGALSLLALTFSALSGCGSRERDPGLSGPFAMGPNDGVALVEARDWVVATLNSNFAEIKLDLLGHFETSRNACGREAGGVLKPDLWNRLAQAMNDALQLPKGESKCLEINDHLVDLLKVRMESGQEIELLRANGYNEICSDYQGADTLRRLTQALTEASKVTDKEDCVSGWGSG